MRRDRIEARLRDFFEGSDLDVVVVYLFGSYARGDESSDSDIDLAILCASPPPRTLAHPSIGLAGRLEAQLGRAVQVVVLEEAPVDLVHRVLRDGRLIVDRDPSRRIRFEVKARNEYFDLLPVLRRYRGQAGRAS